MILTILQSGPCDKWALFRRLSHTCSLCVVEKVYYEVSAVYEGRDWLPISFLVLYTGYRQKKGSRAVVFLSTNNFRSRLQVHYVNIRFRGGHIRRILVLLHILRFWDCRGKP